LALQHAPALLKQSLSSADSAMPGLGVTERDARDIAAYLSTLR